MNNTGYQDLFSSSNDSESISSDSIYVNNIYGLDTTLINVNDNVNFQGAVNLNGGINFNSNLNMNNNNINNINITNTKNLNVQNVSGNLRVNINTVANEYVSNTSIGDVIIRSSGKMAFKAGSTGLDPILYIATNNRIGIGEQAPLRALEVAPTCAFRSEMTFAPRGFNNLGVQFFYKGFDNNTYTQYNGGIRSTNSIGFENGTDFITRILFETITGNINMTGSLKLTGVNPSISTSGALFDFIMTDPFIGPYTFLKFQYGQIIAPQNFEVLSSGAITLAASSTGGLSLQVDPTEYIYMNGNVNLQNYNIIGINSISGYGGNDIRINNNLNMNNNNIVNINSITGYAGNDIRINNNLNMNNYIISNMDQINGALNTLTINSGLGYDVEIYRNNADLSITGFLLEDKNISIIGGNLIITSGKRLRLDNGSGTYFTSIKEFDNSSTNKNYILPNVGATSNTDILTCNIAGVMSWGSSAGFNKRVFSMISDGTILTNNTTSTIISDGTIIGSKIIPANTIEAGDTYEIKCGGMIKFLNNENFTIEARISNNIISIAGLQINETLSPAQTTDRFFNLVARTTIRTTGTTANTVSFGTFSCAGVGYSYIFDERFLSLGTFDTTVNNTIDIYAKWTNASNNNSIQLNSCVVNKIY